MPIAELRLIERIRRQAGLAGRLVRTGIGDDCAVLRGSAAKDWLVTTDLTVEGVHFRRDWHPARSVGHRCLARGLSDIAAMGGRPVAAFLSLALPRRTPQRWLDEFMEGYLALARRTGVTLAGGDIAESKEGIVADTMVVGTVPRAKAILRSGSKPGDQIYVSGRLGAAAAALADFRARKRRKVTRFPHKQDRLVRGAPAYFFPEPRLALGNWLGQRHLASSMIDLSDGLSTDLAHICDESRVGAVVYEDAIPMADRGDKALEFALHGGEDYELLFTAPARAKIPPTIGSVKIARIGEIVRSSGMWLVASDGRRRPLRPLGWQHFGRNR